MSVIAKFKVTSIEQTYMGDGINQQNLSTITLMPVIGNSEENKKFWKYTPSGQIKLGTINNEAAEQFELGKEYYIDFRKAF